MGELCGDAVCGFGTSCSDNECHCIAGYSRLRNYTPGKTPVKYCLKVCRAFNSCPAGYTCFTKESYCICDREHYDTFNQLEGCMLNGTTKTGVTEPTGNITSYMSITQSVTMPTSDTPNVLQTTTITGSPPNTTNSVPLKIGFGVLGFVLLIVVLVLTAVLIRRRRKRNGRNNAAKPETRTPKSNNTHNEGRRLNTINTIFAPDQTNRWNMKLRNNQTPCASTSRSPGDLSAYYEEIDLDNMHSNIEATRPRITNYDQTHLNTIYESEPASSRCGYGAGQTMLKYHNAAEPNQTSLSQDIGSKEGSLVDGSGSAETGPGQQSGANSIFYHTLYDTKHS